LSAHASRAKARKSYCTTTEAIQEHGAALSATTGMAIKVIFQRSKGFSFQIPAQEYESASSETQRCFVQVRTGLPASSFVLAHP